MTPVRGAEYAFCVLDEQSYEDISAKALGVFREAEGLTVIIPLEEAQRRNLLYSYVGVHITLNVHSSLEAVGFLAKISAKLAEAGISVNAFSPVYHDHLFIAPQDAERAISLLEELSREAS